MTLSLSDNTYSRLGELIRFGIVGTVAMLIHYGVYYCLSRYVNLNLAFSTGYAISFIFNFFASSLFTFKTKPTLSRFMKFATSHGINYLLQIIIFNFALYLGIRAELAPVMVYTISIPANFLLVRFAMKNKWSAISMAKTKRHIYHFDSCLHLWTHHIQQFRILLSGRALPAYRIRKMENGHCHPGCHTMGVAVGNKTVNPTSHHNGHSSPHGTLRHYESVPPNSHYEICHGRNHHVCHLEIYFRDNGNRKPEKQNALHHTVIYPLVHSIFKCQVLFRNHGGSFPAFRTGNNI